jgi:hypothetical protein
MGRVRPIRGKGAMRRGWRTEQIASPVTIKRIKPGGNGRPAAADDQRQDGGNPGPSGRRSRG